MNGGQKAVLCVALGAALLVIGFATQALCWDHTADGGWFNYAPNNGAIFSESPNRTSEVLVQAAMWLGLVVLWAVACLLVLRRRGGGPTTPPTEES